MSSGVGNRNKELGLPVVNKIHRERPAVINATPSVRQVRHDTSEQHEAESVRTEADHVPSADPLPLDSSALGCDDLAFWKKLLLNQHEGLHLP
jgi:hypothetical protein